MQAYVCLQVTPEQLIEFFVPAGEVKYVRFCTRPADPTRYALVEFSEQPSIIAALKKNGSELQGQAIK